MRSLELTVVEPRRQPKASGNIVNVPASGRKRAHCAGARQSDGSSRGTATPPAGALTTAPLLDLFDLLRFREGHQTVEIEDPNSAPAELDHLARSQEAQLP